MTADGQACLRQPLLEFEDIFRVRLRKKDPAKMEPMKVNQKPDAQPIIAKARRYKAEQREFLNRYMAELERMRFVRSNPQSQWAAAPLLVPKDSKARFRMTVDMRPVNAATEPIAWPTPHIESEVYDFKGSTCYGTVDLVSGYWQLPLEESSQAAHSIITPDGIYSPTRTQRGAVNSVENFQSKVEPLFHEMRDSLKAWLDDFIVHCVGESTLLKRLRHFFLNLQNAWAVFVCQEMRFLH